MMTEQPTAGSLGARLLRDRQEIGSLGRSQALTHLMEISCGRKEECESDSCRLLIGCFDAAFMILAFA